MKNSEQQPVQASAVPESKIKSVYPEPFSSMMSGRVKRKLGDFFGLSNFGINLTTLEPGAMSALKHHHKVQDEFIYILSGTPTLVFGDKEYLMQVGDCFGFKKDEGIGHQLVNRSEASVEYLEIGDRSSGERAEYPDDDLCAIANEDGSWLFTHKDGTPY